MNLHMAVSILIIIFYLLLFVCAMGGFVVCSTMSLISCHHGHWLGTVKSFYGFLACFSFSKNQSKPCNSVPVLSRTVFFDFSDEN